MKMVGALSDGRVRLATETLYGALARMLEDRWIERFDTLEGGLMTIGE